MALAGLVTRFAPYRFIRSKPEDCQMLDNLPPHVFPDFPDDANKHLREIMDNPNYGHQAVESSLL
jgi:hypothetical protein